MSSALVSRSRAMPTGGRRSKPFPRFFASGVYAAAALRAAVLASSPGGGLKTGVPSVLPYGRRISLPVVARPSRRRWASAAWARGSSRSMVRLSLPLATLSRTSPARHFNSSGVAA